MCKYQSRFRVNQRWISAVQRWKSYVSEQRKSALNSADSELFLSETALFSSETALIFSVLNSADSEKIRADQLWNRADQRWCLSCSLNQRWKTSKLWNSAVQRWLTLGLQAGNSEIMVIESKECDVFYIFYVLSWKLEKAFAAAANKIQTTCILIVWIVYAL